MIIHGESGSSALDGLQLGDVLGQVWPHAMLEYCKGVNIYRA